MNAKELFNGKFSRIPDIPQTGEIFTFKSSFPFTLPGMMVVQQPQSLDQPQCQCLASDGEEIMTSKMFQSHLPISIPLNGVIFAFPTLFSLIYYPLVLAFIASLCRSTSLLNKPRVKGITKINVQEQSDFHFFLCLKRGNFSNQRGKSI